VLLTGATGYLGTHILDLLRQETTVRRIICLVRASSSNEARNRISEGLVKRGKHQLNEEERDVECIPASLEKKNFGLEDELFKELSSETTIVIHVCI
jgi:thioester reductase-like protein